MASKRPIYTITESAQYVIRRMRFGSDIASLNALMVSAFPGDNYIIDTLVADDDVDCAPLISVTVSTRMGDVPFDEARLDVLGEMTYVGGALFRSLLCIFREPMSQDSAS